MAKQQKRNLVDEVADRVREFLDDLERLIQPEREPARVPIPVRSPEQQQQRHRQRR